MQREALQPLGQSFSGSRSGGHLKGLVMDDDELIRSLLDEWLSVDGYTALCAAGGAESLDILSAHKPSVVVTDLSIPSIPGMDGLRQ